MKIIILNLLLYPLVALLNPGALNSDPVPYSFDRKKQPGGHDFSVILPANVGQFTRISFTPPSPGLDGEATYKKGDKEIFMLFSISENRKDQRETMNTILTEIRDNKTTERSVSLKKDPAYILFKGPAIAFFAWTRNLYCFSADSKNGDKKALDEFMKAFPY